MTTLDRCRYGLAFGLAVVTLSPLHALARESGIQRTPDELRILVSKDVTGQRFAITANTDDRSLTGNVFFTDGGTAKFLACSRIAQNDFTCSLADTCPSEGRQSGIQSAPGGGVLVSKDVNGQRFAITANPNGTLTGNVFTSTTGAAQFIFCAPADGGGYRCSVADSCATAACVGEFTELPQTIMLPADFFTLPAGCPSYQALSDVVSLPDGFFDPATGRLQGLGEDQIFGAIQKSRQVTGVLAAGLQAVAPDGSATAASTVACPRGGTAAAGDGTVVFDACRVRDTVCTGTADVMDGHLLPALTCTDVERDRTFALGGDVVQSASTEGALLSGVATGRQGDVVAFDLEYDGLAINENALGGRATGTIATEGGFFAGFFEHVDISFPGKNPATDEPDPGFAKIVGLRNFGGGIINVFVFDQNLSTGKLTPR